MLKQIMFIATCLLFVACTDKDMPVDTNTNFNKSDFEGFWVGTISMSFTVQNIAVPDVPYLRRYIKINPVNNNQVLIYDTIINSELGYLYFDSSIATISNNSFSLTEKTISIKDPNNPLKTVYSKTIAPHNATVNKSQLTEQATFSGVVYADNGATAPINGNYNLNIQFVSKTYNPDLLKP